jgi:hypothetical protein
MAEKQREAIQFMRNHPLDTGYRAFRRFIDTWIGMWDSPVDSWKTATFSLKLTILWNVSFALLTLLGLLFASRSGAAAATPLAWVLLSYPALFYFTHSSLRYRYPIDCIMQVLAVYALVYPLSKLAARRTASFSPQPYGRAAAPSAD